MNQTSDMVSYRREYYLKNKDKWKGYYQTEKSRPTYRQDRNKSALDYYYRYRSELLGTKKEYLKQYGIKNKEILKLKKQQYVKKNRERHNARNRNWSRKNQSKRSLMGSNYRIKNKEKLKIARKLYRETHKAERAEYKQRRRTRQFLGHTDSTASTFYKFVRSKPTIPCYYCGKIMIGKTAHIDHIVSIAKSGNHSSENLCASCPDCNMSKGAKSVSEWKTSGQQIFNI